MKKFTLLFLLSLFITAVHAQLNGDGYYRVQNDYSKRYVVVLSDKAEVNISTNELDLTSLESIKYFENVVSDPASVIYIEKKSGGYVLKAQGTDTYSMIGYYVQIYDSPSIKGAYRAGATAAGVTKFISDELSKYEETGWINSNTPQTRDWYIIPVTQEDNKYFGLVPDLSVGSDYYMTFYASFPFNFASEGMKAYYVSNVDSQRGIAVYKELTGDISASTPIFVKCSTEDYSKNKLNLLKTTSSKSPSGNLMKGVFFNNKKKKVLNQVAYNPATMRMLGKLSDGSLGFVTPTDVDFIPANRCYLEVPEGTPAELKLMNGDEYATGIEEVNSEKLLLNEGIYSLTGVKMHNSIDELPTGIYIVNGKKVFIK